MNTPKRFEFVSVSDCPFGDGEPIMTEQAVCYWHEHVAAAADYDPRIEWFAVLLLDAERRLIGHTVFPPGGESYVMAFNREIFRRAIASGAANIICLHNHPNDEAQPSCEDQNHLKSLLMVSRFMEIGVADYLIVTARGVWFSAAQAGWMEIEESVRDMQQEPDRERDRSALAFTLLEPAPELVGLVCDAAHKANNPTHVYLFELVCEFVKGHLTGANGSEPKLSFASRLLHMKREPMIDPVWTRGAIGEGKAVADFIWDKAVSLCMEHEQASRENFNTPVAAEATAASV